MELKDFVAETLKQIVDGVILAQKDISEKGACINPSGIGKADTGLLYASLQKAKTVQLVDFDISLVATEGNEAKGGIGVFVSGFGVGIQGKSDTASSATNKVRFSVPIRLPSVDEPRGA